MSDLSQPFESFARSVGADLYGVASYDRFVHLEPSENPLSIFPEMKSMIVIARRVLRGAMRGIEEGTNFSSTYAMFGYRWLDDNFLTKTTYDLTIHIEEKGYEAVPMFGYSPEGMPKGRAVSSGKPAPNVIVDPYFAAYAAGLGEMGLGGFFITPQFGTRQRFAMILTDAELTPSKIREKSICSDCGACIEACPMGAIDPGKKEKFGLPGKEMKTAYIDSEICSTCPNGAMLGAGRGTKVDRIAAACGRACLVQLENNGKVDNVFQQKFRKRTPWALNVYHRPVKIDENGKATDIGCGNNMDLIGKNR